MFTKSASYLTTHRGSYYLKLPIPPELQHHFPSKTSRPRTHIVQPLGTGRRSDADKLKRPLLAYYWSEFQRLEGGTIAAPAPAIEAAYLRARQIRAAVQEVHERPASEAKDDAAFALEDMAESLAEDVGRAVGPDAADDVYTLATITGLTLLEAVKEWNHGASIKASTKAKRALAVRELLEFLRRKDCAPAYVTDDRAAAFVAWLNSRELGYSTKQDRVSMLHVLWQYLSRRRLVPKKSSPWTEHEITGRGLDSLNKRGWTDAELQKLFGAPDDSPARAHYRRPLFRELYTLGLTTGARLDSLVSLTPERIKAMEGAEKGYWLSIVNDKTAAGTRTIPVVHPAAVAVLSRRLKLQKDRTASIFPECRPGGFDNNQSHHVSKALGRDRDRLGFGAETDFHSTRRCLSTVLENAGVELIYCQRYIGHAVSGGGLMTGTYSDGASKDNLMKVARAVRYSAAVEEALFGVASRAQAGAALPPASVPAGAAQEARVLLMA